jgi:Pyruvate/2-oxoacid:ferredoxin oxidoreductase gamma subunit
VTAGLKKGGTIVLNTEETPEALAKRFPGFKTRVVPAKRIALAHKLGSATSPVVNTAMCGAICAIFKLADEASLEAAIREAVPVKHDENAAAAREAFEFCSKEDNVHAEA